MIVFSILDFEQHNIKNVVCRMKIAKNGLSVKPLHEGLKSRLINQCRQ